MLKYIPESGLKAGRQYVFHLDIIYIDKIIKYHASRFQQVICKGQEGLIPTVHD